MSYASRLVAMSRGTVPATQPRVVGGAAEPPREVLVETQAAPREAVNPVRDAAAPPPATPFASTQPARPIALAPEAEPAEPSPRGESTPHVVHEVAERQVFVARGVVPAAAAELPAAGPSAASAPAALPPQARWLTEDTAAPDPLVASAESDALRELMRSVRQWTASAPQVLEEHTHATPPDAPAMAIAVPQPGTQVSIGNVTVTVEDVPRGAPARDGAPRVASDRLARNHIRGG